MGQRLSCSQDLGHWADIGEFNPHKLDDSPAPSLEDCSTPKGFRQEQCIYLHLAHSRQRPGRMRANFSINHRDSLFLLRAHQKTETGDQGN